MANVDAVLMAWNRGETTVLVSNQAVTMIIDNVTMASANDVCRAISMCWVVAVNPKSVSERRALIL
ncbi:hypothetical protein D3C84_914510 [compost metagenome]